MAASTTENPASGGDITERIGEVITATKQTANQFAKQAGISSASIYNIMSRRNSPSKSTIEKILGKYAWINRQWLLSGNGEMKKEEPKPKPKPVAAEPTVAEASPVSQPSDNGSYERDILRAQVELMQQIIVGRDREIARMNDIIELLREKLIR